MTTTQPPTSTTTTTSSQVTLPRLTIEFCIQCKWNLRAAYYAQELLQTFGTSLGEVALVPSTGGRFVVTLFTAAQSRSSNHYGESKEGDDASTIGQGETVEVKQTMIWDRKVDGGFPDTKVLKGRVRDAVEPGRGLGHTDRALGRGEEGVKLEVGARDGTNVAEIKQQAAPDVEQGRVQGVDERSKRDVHKEGVSKEVSIDGDVNVKVGREVVGKVVSNAKHTEVGECKDCS